MEFDLVLQLGSALIRSMTIKAMREHGHGGMFADCERYHSC